MTKPLLLAVHGMGTFTEEGFKKDVETFLDDAYKTFNDSKKFSERVQIEVIVYDDIWNEVRKKLANNAGTVEQRLEGINGIGSLVNELTRYEADFNKDSFFYTNCLDVILYRSFFGERAQVKVAKAFLQHLIEAKANSQPIYILAHSLGTAVVHDTLHKLYLNDFTANEQKEIGSDNTQIDPEENQIDGIFMVANVSRIVGAGKNPYDSIVKPGTGGICTQYANIRHHLDPFTIPKQFDPPNDGSWITKSDWEDFFRTIEFKEVTQWDVHSLSHYLENPAVHSDIFYTVLEEEFNPTDEDNKKAIADYEAKTLQAGYEKLGEVLKSVDIRNVSTIEAYLNALDRFLQRINNFS